VIADMHCHVDLFPDYVGVVREATAQNVCILAVTTTPKAFRGNLDRLKGFSNVRVALGLHPQLAHIRSTELSMWERLVSETAFVGEVGLDGSPGYRQYASVQLSVFKRILHICRNRGGKILTVHSRGAATEVIASLGDCRDCGLPILHWFTGTKAELEMANRLDCWFSVGPAMLQKQSGVQRVLAMPRGRILLETDAPFGKVNGQVLKPLAVLDALAKLAIVWGVDVAEAEGQIRGNQRRICELASLAVR
jgi:TatD DNase family protein